MLRCSAVNPSGPVGTFTSALPTPEADGGGGVHPAKKPSMTTETRTASVFFIFVSPFVSGLLGGVRLELTEKRLFRALRELADIGKAPIEFDHLRVVFGGERVVARFHASNFRRPDVVLLAVFARPLLANEVLVGPVHRRHASVVDRDVRLLLFELGGRVLEPLVLLEHRARPEFLLGDSRRLTEPAEAVSDDRDKDTEHKYGEYYLNSNRHRTALRGSLIILPFLSHSSFL